jgi:hypothetical protein
MLLPLTIGVVFVIVQAISIIHKILCMGRQRAEAIKSAGGLISAFLVLFYILYMYLTKTVFDIFNCTPIASLPDGQTYLQVVFEPCGVPGLTQMALLPYAIIALIVYTVGYPAFLVNLLWRNHELIMEDQLLRAKGVGNDLLTNPHAYHLRRRYGRTYYQFKPDSCIWILVIIARKFCIAICSLMFQRNSSFQMSACLLVLFLAYALQVRFLPYMSPGDHESVLKQHADACFSSRVHARLRATLHGVETRGRKRARSNLLTYEGKVDRSAILGVLAGWIFNYNTVEAVLLFAGVIVCLCALMYQAGSNDAAFNVQGVTFVLLFTIAFALLYYFTCVITEVVILMNEVNRTKALAVAKRSNRRSTVAAANDKPSLTPSGEPNIGKVDSMLNPMFMSGEVVSAASTSSAAFESIVSMHTSPPPELWNVFQKQYIDMHAQIDTLSAELAKAKVAQQRAPDAHVEEERRQRRKSEFSPQPSVSPFRGSSPIDRNSPGGSAMPSALDTFKHHNKIPGRGVSAKLPKKADAPRVGSPLQRARDDDTPTPTAQLED